MVSQPQTAVDYFDSYVQIAATADVGTSSTTPTTIYEISRGASVNWQTFGHLWLSGVENLTAGKTLTVKIFAKVSGSYLSTPHDSNEYEKQDALNGTIGPLGHYDDVKIVGYTDEASGTKTITVTGILRDLSLNSA